MINANSTDKISVVGLVEPVASAATVTSGWVLAANAYSYLVAVQSGTAGTSVDAKIEQATDGSGTGAKDLSGSSITQLTAAGSAVIQFKASDLDSANDFDYFRVSVTKVGATSIASATVIAVDPRYAPLADASEIDEVVTV